MGVYDKNKGKPGKKPNYYLRYKVKGELIRERAQNATNRKAAYAELAEFKRQLKIGTWVHPNKRQAADDTFAEYARKVLAKRIARGVATAESTEAAHIDNHLVPVFGALRLSEMTFRTIRDGFAEHINTKGLAGRYVRNIHSTLRAILVEAVEDELIDNAPMTLKVDRDHLPPPVDKDPEFRDNAQFTRAEIRQLLSLENIDSMLRVLYTTYFMTGARFKELVLTKVRDRNRDLMPLPCLSIHAVKTGRHKRKIGRKRHVPEHPELTAWLDWYLEEEYEILHGHKPQPSDYLFPTHSALRKRRGAVMLSHREVYNQWKEHHLPAAGLRHRRIHDARRTFLSALKNAGVADNDIRRKLTHWSPEDAVLDAYTNIEWETLCNAVLKVNWDMPKPPRSHVKVAPSVVSLDSRRKGGGGTRGGTAV